MNEIDPLDALRAIESEHGLDDPESLDAVLSNLASLPHERAIDMIAEWTFPSAYDDSPN